MAWWFGWLFAGALYLLLIDTTDLPELIVGAGAAAIAATGFELAREQRVAGGMSARLRWLGRLYRPLRQRPFGRARAHLARRPPTHPTAKVNGEFRSVPFQTHVQKRETGRRALAESFGSFAPNTIIIGVDAERELLLGHQLRRRGGDEAIDVLRLGRE